MNEEQRMNQKEAEALREVFSLTPGRVRRASSPASVVDFPVAPPPAPRKLRREHADDIIEQAMKLMDMVMEQNRWIKRLEKCIDENYKS